MIRANLGTNVLVPLSADAKNILDVGTGSGKWCIEVAEGYPGANVRGIDLSQIERSGVPDNCEFMVMDASEGLKFDGDSHDLVHFRCVVSHQFTNGLRILRAGILKNQWPVYMNEIYRILKPGTGWLQCSEFNPCLHCDDGSVPENAPLYKVYSIFKRKHVNDLVSRRSMQKYFERQGYIFERWSCGTSNEGCWVR